MTADFGWVETAYAKINLALHVRRKQADGYHQVESLFAFAAGGDMLSAQPGDGLTLRISGPFAKGLTTGADNLVLRAAEALRQSFGVEQGVALALEKNLPVASGIGGGSADGAAAIRLLAKLWSIDQHDPKLVEIAKRLGADVPACLASATQFGDDRGDVLTSVDGSTIAGAPLLLVNPGVPLSTADVFARWDGVDNGALARGDPVTAAIGGRNDLTAAACAIVPQIREIIDRLGARPGVILARMSGSGATCFAIFDSVASRDSAGAQISLAMPRAWCMKSELR